MIRYSLERTVFITANRHSKCANMLSYAKEIYHACAHGSHRFANRVRKLFSHTIDIRLVLDGGRTHLCECSLDVSMARENAFVIKPLWTRI
eukprot:scaffold4101_cov147-Skeletonema_marinoi.AAC.10